MILYGEELPSSKIRRQCKKCNTCHFDEGLLNYMCKKLPKVNGLVESIFSLATKSLKLLQVVLFIFWNLDHLKVEGQLNDTTAIKLH